MKKCLIILFAIGALVFAASQENAKDDRFGIEMVLVNGGTFIMGCTSEQGNNCLDNEKPAHSVTVSDFYIGKYEVTQSQWIQVMGSNNNPSSFKGGNLPVETVSWNDIHVFIQKLNSATGKKYRLPTEAEWEYAARGGSKSKGYKYSGSNNVEDVGWYVINSGDRALNISMLEEYAIKSDIDGFANVLTSNRNRTWAVGTKLPNELGIYNMSGNVWEWCSDWYGDYSSKVQTNPIGPTRGSYRVFRGGGWSYAIGGCRVSSRVCDDPNSRNGAVGFRLVQELGGRVDVKAMSDSFASSQERVKDDKVEIEMVFVKGGTFRIGCTSEQGRDCSDNEKPVHNVTVSDFYIGKYEVTQAQWVYVMGGNDTPSYFKGDNLPIVSVSWDDVQEFILRLNKMTLKKYRLPTEAEWEYAARGGASSKGYKYSGSSNINYVAWYNVNSGDKVLRDGLFDEYFIEKDDADGYNKILVSNRNRIRIVGTKSQNELGIYDMSGNVWEWVNDWYGSYNSVDQINPVGPLSGSRRVNRGGSWDYDARLCRVSIRYGSIPGGRYNNIGFRIVLSP